MLRQVLHVISIDGLDKNSKARPFDAASDSSTALSGLESFTLAYRVDWPLNVVLSKATLTKYRWEKRPFPPPQGGTQPLAFARCRWLFRHLFAYKCVERELCTAWSMHQGTKSLDSHQVVSQSPPPNPTTACLPTLPSSGPSTSLKYIRLFFGTCSHPSQFTGSDFISAGAGSHPFNGIHSFWAFIPSRVL